MNVAIVVAAGHGARMGGERAKQFLELGGVPILIHAIKAFEESEAIQEIIAVVPSTQSANFVALANQYGLRKLSKVIPGGITRSESVFNGLQAVREATAEIVAVHDGVRPFVTADEINRTVAAAREHEAAILVAPVTDTIKQIDGDHIVATLNRGSLRRALTPQCFRYSLLRRAYESVDVHDPDLTDESMLVERLGVKVMTVEGSPRNIKITTPEDLMAAEAMLKG